MIKIAIVYHAYKNDDGINAAVLVANYLYESNKHIYNFDIDLLPEEHKSNEYYKSEVNPLIEKFKDYDEIYVVDFSYPKKWLDELEKSVMVLDHHMIQLTDFDLFNFSYAIFPKDEYSDCATTLVYEEFYREYHNYPLPELLDHIRNRDIGLNGYYEGSIPESEAINLGLSSVRKEYKTKYTNQKDFVIKYANFLLNDDSCMICRLIGKKEVEHRDKLIEEFLNTYRDIPVVFYKDLAIPYCTINEKNPFTELNKHYSVVTYRFLKYAREKTDINFKFAAFEHPNCNVSFRSDGFSTLETAMDLGGKGHTKASGCSNNEKVDNFFKNIGTVLFKNNN
jgi:hypothetical protein